MKWARGFIQSFVTWQIVILGELLSVAGDLLMGGNGDLLDVVEDLLAGDLHSVGDFVLFIIGDTAPEGLAIGDFDNFAGLLYPFGDTAGDPP